jgi:AraC-like DNA-binding protein
MKRVSRPLLVLHPDGGLRDRVRTACGDDYQFVQLPDWEALEAAIRDAPPAAMVLVDPYLAAGEAAGRALSPRLRELLLAYPSTPMIAAMAVTAATHEDVRQLGSWGVVQVIALGHDDTVAAIARRLQGARGRPMRALLEQVLPPETSGRARAIIDAAADVVAMGEHGRDLAETLQLSRRTLLRWSERSGLPPPRRLLAWMRVLLACELLDDPGRSVLSVARTAGYASDSGLRRITQKFLRASPTDLREQGAFARATAAFVEELTAYRLKVRVTTREG